MRLTPLSKLPPIEAIEALRPMLLDRRRTLPFDGDEWLFEIKFDGFRMLAEFGAGRVVLRTRSGHDWTVRFPEVVEQLERYGGGPHVVDAELAVLDKHGRSDFDRLRARAGRRRRPGDPPVVLCMFDCLVMAGRDLTGLPIEERKARLERLFTPRPTQGLLVVTAIEGRGRDFFAYALKLELEGLIAKRRGSLYRPGERAEEWRKIKRKGAVPAGRFKRR